MVMLSPRNQKPQHLIMLKAELRRSISQQKRQFTPQQLAQLSLSVLERLRPLLGNAKVILAYDSLPDEVDTHALLDELVAAGASLCEGAYHIMEPIGETFTAADQIDIALIPGLAFDAQGHRLGRGKGYYDRFLSAFRGKTIGVCFDFQKVAEVPVDAHDVAVDRVV